MAAKRKKSRGTSVQFIVCDEKNPQVALKAGMKLEVISTELLGPNLKRIKNIGARLCGGSSTCLALIELGDDVINPSPLKAKRSRR